MINQQTLQFDIAPHFDLIQRLQKIGRTEEAISALENASNLFPEEYFFKLLKNLFIPIVYATSDEVSFYRQRFERGLQELIQQTSLGTPEEKSNALAGISRVTNFYLAYQAGNIRELQQQYGTLVHKVVAANYPNWVGIAALEEFYQRVVRKRLTSK